MNQSNYLYGNPYTILKRSYTTWSISYETVYSSNFRHDYSPLKNVGFRFLILM